MKKNVCKKNLVSGYMRLHKTGITSLEALEMFGALRLSSIIHKLREEGMDIVTVMIDLSDRWGNPIKIARYVYRGGKAV